MSQCVDGFKHVCNSLLRCFDIDIGKSSGGPGDPELLARDTVCNALSSLLPYALLSVIMLQWHAIYSSNWCGTFFLILIVNRFGCS